MDDTGMSSVNDLGYDTFGSKGGVEGVEGASRDCCGCVR